MRRMSLFSVIIFAQALKAGVTLATVPPILPVSGMLADEIVKKVPFLVQFPSLERS
ncbi:MAG: hypothetical protein QNJ97_19875 [Myxococcota bacterium]|nr:hypothetical protein [Myxococcota bacterium]